MRVLTEHSPKIVILGGGTAGIITASLLRHHGFRDLVIVEPSVHHFYQPLWTLVGAGFASASSTRRPESRYIPRGVRWIREAVMAVEPEVNKVQTESGLEIRYDFLVVATGAQFDWSAIPGLREAIQRGEASSNYDFHLAQKTWKNIRRFQGGTALFHMPGSPIKCPGAPQKIMYLAADYFRRAGLANRTKVMYGSGLATIYGVKEYATVLDGVVQRYGIEARFQHELTEIRPERKEAIFELRNGGEKRTATIPYEMLHVVPPHRAPECVRRSELADPRNPSGGWVAVDKHTLQHVKFSNVFALGDVANTPNAKTGAAASRQAAIVAENLVAAQEGKELPARYDGYIACPIVTGYGRMLLCEVDYTGQPSPRLPWIDTLRERYDMWLLKKYGLPWLYWNVLLKGKKLPIDEIRTRRDVRQNSRANSIKSE
ncbi:MAG TPA: FAD/NAD(P)-binding oxidoreductase [Candidatus Acidoferrum sp.]|nr:FAD/NAD(P)-binding oxidoreductase [Candidatus Acidoferrum sp.]